MRVNKSKEYLKNHPVIYEKAFSIKNPFEILNIKELTDIQKSIMKHAEYFKYYLSFAFSASCGSGKTLAGIYLIHYFGIKTLIISSRSSINDQWYNILTGLYPDISIETMNNKPDNPLILIYSPQYLIKHLKDFPLDVNFIIYDEIHSLISDCYGKCIVEPIKQYKEKSREKLPYILALSGTYPQKNKLIKNIFGGYIKTEADITEIPIYIHDYHLNILNELVAIKNDMKTNDNLIDYKEIEEKYGIKYFLDRENHWKIIKKQLSKIDLNNIDVINSFSEINSQTLIKLDKFYNPLDEFSYIDWTLKNIDMSNKINDKEITGFIITNTIKSALYAAVKYSYIYSCNVLLMRAVNESSYFIKNFDIDLYLKNHIKDTNYYEKILNGNSLEKLLYNYVEDGFLLQECNEFIYDDVLKNDSVKKFKIKGNLMNIIKENDVRIICGCIARLKEGISIENAVWGICSKFVYSTIIRTQILGRIRRTSNNEYIKNYPREFYVISGNVRDNEYQLMFSSKKYHKKIDKNDIKLIYDYDYERTIFSNENYIYSYEKSPRENISKEKTLLIDKNPRENQNNE